MISRNGHAGIYNGGVNGKPKRMRVTVTGTGYVGTVTGACLAYLGHQVTCVDTDARKIEMLRAGEIPLYEPFLKELLEMAVTRGGIDFTTDIAESAAESDVIFIAVGTPPLPSGEANLSYLEAVARAIGRSIDDRKFRVVVNKSTVPVGCGNLVEALIREGIAEAQPAKARSIEFEVASNPEFLREGCAIGDSLYPDRIVVGTDSARAQELLRTLYQPLIDQEFEAPPFMPRPANMKRVPMLTTTLTSSEMIKYASNAFLATKIGFANEIANICERVGADSKEVMAGIGLDARIGSQFLNAGVGWGGSCFGKDIHSLLHTAHEYGYQARLLEASLEVNKAQRLLVVQKLLEKLYILKGRSIALLGLAFKPDTDDLRDAPSLTIAEKLLQMGARIKAYDPVAMDACKQQFPDLKMQYCASAEEALSEADAMVLVTEWSEFRTLSLYKAASLMRTRVLIDGRNVYDPAQAVAAGFDYTGIGRRLPFAPRTRVLESVS
jgi:UDPglucose 6-dehydrogenase